MFTQRLGIHFSSEDVKNPCHFECPHRLSDKLLKSSCDALQRSVARWRILRFPLSESTSFFRSFLFQPGGLFAVVPCRWRRIIGSRTGMTSGKMHFYFNRSSFVLNAYFCCFLMASGRSARLFSTQSAAFSASGVTGLPVRTRTLVPIDAAAAACISSTLSPTI